MLQSSYFHDQANVERNVPFDDLPVELFLKNSHSYGVRDDIILQVMNGLRLPQKKVPPVLLYDQNGKRLLAEMSHIDVYYPARTEANILKNNLTDLSTYLGQRIAVIELGSGPSINAELLLGHIDAESYTCIDVSDSGVRATSSALHKTFSNLKIKVLPADFTKLSALPQSRFAFSRLLFLPGSTICNFEPNSARQMLSHMRSLLSDGDAMLLSVDLKKERNILLRAYNDIQGVTARFNLNILEHINRVARASFNPVRFSHRADFNEKEGRIELHLVSKIAQIVYVDGQMFKFKKDETILTGSSYKYDVSQFVKLATDSQFTVEKTWIDDNKMVSIHLLRVNRHGFH